MDYRPPSGCTDNGGSSPLETLSASPVAHRLLTLDAACREPFSISHTDFSEGSKELTKKKAPRGSGRKRRYGYGLSCVGEYHWSCVADGPLRPVLLQDPCDFAFHITPFYCDTRFSDKFQPVPNPFRPLGRPLGFNPAFRWMKTEDS